MWSWKKFYGIKKELEIGVEEFVEKSAEELHSLAESAKVKASYLLSTQYVVNKLGREFLEEVAPEHLEIARRMYKVGGKTALVLYSIGVKELNDLTEELLEDYENKVPPELRPILSKTVLGRIVSRAKISIIPCLTDKEAYHLVQAGISSFEDLVEARYEEIKSHLSITEESFSKWRDLAKNFRQIPDPRKVCKHLELKKIKGIGDEFATFFAALGITTLEGFARQDISYIYELIDLLPDHCKSTSNPLSWKVQALKLLLERSKCEKCEMVIEMIESIEKGDRQEFSDVVARMMKQVDFAKNYREVVDMVRNNWGKVVGIIQRETPGTIGDKADVINEASERAYKRLMKEDGKDFMLSFLAFALRHSFDPAELGMYINYQVNKKNGEFGDPPEWFWILVFVLLFLFLFLLMVWGSVAGTMFLLGLALLELVVFTVVALIKLTHLHIRIYVYDQAGDPIRDAVIRVKGEEHLYYTNENGYGDVYIFTLRGNRKATVCVSYWGENNENPIEYLSECRRLSNLDVVNYIARLDQEYIEVRITLKRIRDVLRDLDVNINEETSVQLGYFVEDHHVNGCGHAGLWIGFQDRDQEISILKYEIQDFMLPATDEEVVFWLQRRDGIMVFARIERSDGEGAGIDRPHTTLQVQASWGDILRYIVAPIEMEIMEVFDFPYNLFYNNCATWAARHWNGLFEENNPARVEAVTIAQYEAYYRDRLGECIPVYPLDDSHLDDSHPFLWVPRVVVFETEQRLGCVGREPCNVGELS